MSGMNWEKVKGFCRRQKQRFEENYRHGETTRDEEADQGMQRVLLYRGVSAAIASKLDRINANARDTVEALHGIKEDMKAMGLDEMNLNATRLEVVVLALSKQQEALNVGLGAASGALRRYVEECGGVEGVAEDRRKKKLEYDFFRNKVAGLKAHPPADPARIPRNETRLEEWQRLYDEANDRLKNLSHNLTLSGIRAVSETHKSSTAELTRFYGDGGNLWRATFGGGGGFAAPTIAATAAMGAAVASGQRAIEHVAGQNPKAMVGNLAIAAAPPSAVPTSPGRGVSPARSPRNPNGSVDAYGGTETRQRRVAPNSDDPFAM